MASDQLVSARALLDAELELKRRGSGQVLTHLVSTEPELASYLMEHASLLYQRLWALGGPAKATQRVYRQMEALLLVGLLALRHGQLQLWQKQIQAGPLGALEPPEEPSTPPSAPGDPV